MSHESIDSPEKQEESSEEFVSIGRLDIYCNFQTGLQLWCTFDGQQVDVHLSPSEALGLARLINDHTSDLEAPIAEAVEDAIRGRDVIARVVDTGRGPDPIPFERHGHGDIAPKPYDASND